MRATLQFIVDVVILLKGEILKSFEFTIDLVLGLAYDLQSLPLRVNPCDPLYYGCDVNGLLTTFIITHSSSSLDVGSSTNSSLLLRCFISFDVSLVFPSLSNILCFDTTFSPSFFLPLIPTFALIRHCHRLRIQLTLCVELDNLLLILSRSCKLK